MSTRGLLRSNVPNLLEFEWRAMGVSNLRPSVGKTDGHIDILLEVI